MEGVGKGALGGVWLGEIYDEEKSTGQGSQAL